jgi:hypothetical protein
MKTIAQELDDKLKDMDAPTASVVERWVRDALALVEVQGQRKDVTSEIASHREFIARFAGVVVDEPWERPSQGELEQRDEWR